MTVTSNNVLLPSDLVPQPQPQPRSSEKKLFVSVSLRSVYVANVHSCIIMYTILLY